MNPLAIVKKLGFGILMKRVQAHQAIRVLRAANLVATAHIREEREWILEVFGSGRLKIPDALKVQSRLDALAQAERMLKDANKRGRKEFSDER